MIPASGQSAARPSRAQLPARTRNPAAGIVGEMPASAVSGPLDDPRDRVGNYARTDLGPEPASAAQARRLTRAALDRWHLGHLADDAVSIASELAANAVKAATRPAGTLPAIIFAVHRRPGEVRVIIWDNGPGKPELTEPGPNAEGGRGLAIIDHLTGGNWGWWPTSQSGGKVIWAAIPDPARNEPSARACWLPRR